MIEERFKLPGSSYEEITKIIKAYGHYQSPVAPGEVSKVAAIDPTIVSRNNAFLVAIGVLEGGKKKMITSKGQSLSRALDHDMPDEIRKNWHEVVMTNEFLQKLVSAVRIRKGMEESTLRAHVAYSAGLAKKQIVMTGAGAVIDILRAAGLVKEEDGKLIAMMEEAQKSQEIGALSEKLNIKDKSVQQEQFPIVTRLHTKEGVSVNIQIQIQCSASEIENLSPKLKTLIKELSAIEVKEGE